MSHSIEGLAGIQGNDYNVRVSGKERGDVMKDGNYSSSIEPVVRNAY